MSNIEYLEFAKEIAYEAGKIMLKYLNAKDISSYKGDKTIVTLADKEINTYLINRVKERFPNHSVDGEEEKFGESNYVWVCDPVDGMTFYEGTSKVELKDDASVLPHDVPYKGQTTNELVFMLTNTNKKIRSGADMSRADAYAAIKANGLQEECVKRFGKGRRSRCGAYPLQSDH